MRWTSEPWKEMVKLTQLDLISQFAEYAVRSATSLRSVGTKTEAKGKGKATERARTLGKEAVKVLLGKVAAHPAVVPQDPKMVVRNRGRVPAVDPWQTRSVFTVTSRDT